MQLPLHLQLYIALALVRNAEIREELKQEGVLEKVKQSLVRWREALAQMGPERLVRRVYEAEMEGRRGRGHACRC